MKLAPWIALGLVAAGFEPADAGTCGGSSGGSSSDSDSSSDSSWSDSSDSSDSTPARPPCIETTDVHGYRECTKFGRWGKAHRLPGFHVELGTAMRRFASPLGERRGTVSHGDDTFAYRVVGGGATESAVPLDTAIVAQLRLGIALPHGLYVAGEGELGTLQDPSTTSTAEMTSTGERGTPGITLRGVTVASGAAIAGVRGRVGRTSLGVEAAAGYRALIYTYDSHYLACETTTSLTATMPILEGRARATYWLSPQLSVGASVGISAIDEAWVGGIFLGGHSRAFDGH